MIFFRPMRSDSHPKKTKSGVVTTSATRHEQVRRLPVDLERALQERERVELARVPDHALARRWRRTARGATYLRFTGLVKLSLSGFFEALPLPFSFVKSGDSFILTRM